MKSHNSIILTEYDHLESPSEKLKAAVTPAKSEW